MRQNQEPARGILAALKTNPKPHLSSFHHTDGPMEPQKTLFLQKKRSLEDIETALRKQKLELSRSFKSAPHRQTINQFP
jgi:hypothetical protein